MSDPKYHIHIDAQSTTPEFERRALSDWGFQPQDFVHGTGHESYEPNRHLTLKPPGARSFKAVYDDLEEYLKGHPGAMKGYLEAECVVSDLDLPETPYQSRPIPFRVTRKHLGPGEFREDEIHVTMDQESDERTRNALLEMGLYIGLLPKPWGFSGVYTLQGTRAQIGQLLDPLMSFLLKMGGSKRCSIKEERIAYWWRSGPDTLLPPVIDRIDWLG